jgi:hypothetical protein
MRIEETFRWQNSVGEYITFNVRDAFYVDNIEGLSGLTNEIRSSKGVNQDGITVIGASLSARNITMTGSIMRNVDANRQRLLSAFNPKYDGTFYYDNTATGLSVSISGLVEQAPTISVTEVEGVEDFYISILCPDPFFKGEEQSIELATWEPEFHFPLNLPPTGFNYASRSTSLTKTISNPGQVEGGVTVMMTFTGSVTDPLIINSTTGDEFKAVGTFGPTDQIVVTSGYNNNRVRLNGENALQIMDFDSAFLTMRPGDNNFIYNAAAGVDALNITIVYSPYYLGV